MIVLDENILGSQRTQLRWWRVHLCQIGIDVGRKGMQDDEIITLLARNDPAAGPRLSDLFAAYRQIIDS